MRDMEENLIDENGVLSVGILRRIYDEGEARAERLAKTGVHEPSPPLMFGMLLASIPTLLSIAEAHMALHEAIESNDVVAKQTAEGRLASAMKVRP
jgi:hypothetical protein